MTLKPSIKNPFFFRTVISLSDQILYLSLNGDLTGGLINLECDYLLTSVCYKMYEVIWHVRELIKIAWFWEILASCPQAPLDSDFFFIRIT